MDWTGFGLMKKLSDSSTKNFEIDLDLTKFNTFQSTYTPMYDGWAKRINIS